MSRKLLDMRQLTRACYLAGAKATAREIANDIGVQDVDAVRSGLSLCDVRLSPKPYGFREVSVSLSPAQVEGLRAVAREQGIVGLDAHQRLLEQAARRLAADRPLLAAFLDPTQEPIFIDAALMSRVRAEAARRQMTALVLAARLLNLIDKDAMYGAIIDEDEEG